MNRAESDEARTISEVQASTRFLLDSFKEKMSDLREWGPQLRRLLKFGVNAAAASKTSEAFFGSGCVQYMAIDGTQGFDQQLDLVVFYVGAFAYSGSVRFTPDSVEVSPPSPAENSLSVSAAIPLAEEDAAVVFGQKREPGVEVDPERLPSSLMHAAEYFLAYRAASKGGPRIILLDRTLAGDVAHLVWSTRDFVESGACVLEGAETPHGTVTRFDLELARMLLPNKELHQPAPRSQLLKFAAVIELLGGEDLTAEELIARTGANEGWAERLADDLRNLDRKFGMLDPSAKGFRLCQTVQGYWDRVLHASVELATRVFFPESGHPLRVRKSGVEVWVTADDLDFLVLVFSRALCRISWHDRVLPIGLVKDTNAYEFVKTALPLVASSGLVVLLGTPPKFNSDKMLLQTNSVVNARDIPTPWHTPDIDAAFRTMAPQIDPELPPGTARVNGAYGNVIYPERTYVKTYIQLWSSSSSPEVRSHVFAYDRPVYPGYDHWDELVLMNRDGPVDGEIRPVLHLSRDSELTNLVMALLTEMGKEVIPEALGHNYPLFLADKKAKAILNETREAYKGAVALELARSDMDQQVLFSRRFRDYRSQIEGRRKG